MQLLRESGVPNLQCKQVCIWKTGRSNPVCKAAQQASGSWHVSTAVELSCTCSSVLCEGDSDANELVQSGRQGASIHLALQSGQDQSPAPEQVP